MGRVPLIIDKDKLLNQIKTLESTNTYTNQSQLFEAICKSEFGQSIVDGLGRPRTISPVNIYQYCKNYGLFGEITTPKGKRGGGLAGKRDRKSRREKFAKHPQISTIKHELTKDIAWVAGGQPVNGKYGRNLNENRLKIVNKIIDGSATAAIRGKCLQCCNNQASEAARCNSVGCALYLLNPYLKHNYEEINDDN